MFEQAVSESTSRSVQAGTEVHLLDLLAILVRERKLIIGMPVLTGIVTLAASLLMDPIFGSTAKIMPPQQQQSSGVAAMLGQLGGLAGAASGIAGIKNPNDVYVGLLESRTVADSLIARFNLKQRYESRTMDDARRKLAAVTSVATGKKDGFITIGTEDKDPQFAATLANAYVEELTKLTQSMAITEASQRRLFFENQLKEAADQLANAEVALRGTQESTGMIEPDAQVKAIITSVAQLRGAISAKQVQISAMKTFAANQNPDLLRAQEEMRGLEAQLSKLEKARPARNGDFMVPISKIPAIGVEYVRGVRNVKYYETIFELLAKQFELAKIDEAKNSSMIQILDKAIPAEHKIKPRRAILTIAGTVAGALLGLILAFLRAAVRGSRISPAGKQRWQRVSSEWKKA
jgi:tyrosine-protein kinase Etk/Wzc